MKLEEKYQMWRDMIRSDQMSPVQVIDFLNKNKRFASWYRNENTAEECIIDIDNWFKMMDGLCGTISNHPRQHEFKSPSQLTSRMLDIDNYNNWKEGDLVQSESGHTYRLGKKYELETLHTDSKD